MIFRRNPLEGFSENWPVCVRLVLTHSLIQLCKHISWPTMANSIEWLLVGQMLPVRSERIDWRLAEARRDNYVSSEQSGSLNRESRAPFK